MKPVPIGSRIRPFQNSNDHHYVIGNTYTVSEVKRRAFRATDENGKQRDWLVWEDCEPAPSHGWELCQEVLAPEIISFLSAFEGIETIALKPSIKDKILQSRPNLHEEILSAAGQLKEKLPASTPETVNP